MGIIIGLISALMLAVAGTYRKKAVDNSSLPVSMFGIFGPTGGLIIISLLFFLLGGIDYNLITLKILIFALIIAIIEVSYTYIDYYVFKKTKISYLLPYSNSNKLFIILIGFFIFFGTDNSTSITTFIISLITIFLIILSNIDFKNLKFDKIILIYLFGKILSAISMLLIGYILLNISTISYMSINIGLLIPLYLSIILISGHSFSKYKQQTKVFYKSRLLAVGLGWTGYVIGVYLIESQGLLIATLLGFIGLVFSVFSMKFILNDTPSKKQITLAFIVAILIGIGYYFK